MPEAEPLHFDCVACQSRSYERQDNELATMTILRMLSTGFNIDEIVDDLCFEHRSRLQLHVKPRSA
jgi:hypothetical protein